MSEKIDFKKRYRDLYQPPKGEISVVDVPPLNYLMIDGKGDPNGSEEYTQAVAALFSVSYALRFMLKKSGVLDYGVMPLEGLWWAENHDTFLTGDRQSWLWTMMILQPEPIDAAQVQEAIALAKAKKPSEALDRLRFEACHEGRAAQLLHIGPFSEEGPNIQRLHDFIGERGTLAGKHHEIYLSDIIKAAPQNWKTIIRQPFTD